MNKFKILLVALMGSVFILACSNDGELESVESTKIEPNDEVIKFLLSDHTFVETHEYYLNMKIERSGEKNYDNLKTLLIADLIKSKNLAQTADKELIAFYVDELSELDFFFLASGYSSLLFSLEGYWSNEKLHQYANDFIKRNESFVNNLKYPDNDIRNKNDFASGMKRMIYTKRYYQLRI